MIEVNPLEPYLSIIGSLVTIIGQHCTELLTDMSSDAGTSSSRWSDEERATLINFLLEEKRAGRVGEGGFKSTTLTAAAAHMSSCYPNRSWASQQCKNQINAVRIQCDCFIDY